ncbi:DUF3306 domain-containing protein [Marinibacterium sp. SX1]|uniref:DUF3306 domain-containing protein n=1 Tax=Marinibacterium sp. SX1 TaxID=3388424 RepID=UPI003D1681F7
MSDFWARRKAAVAAEARAEATAQAVAEEARHDAALAERSDAELLDAAGMPDPDTLQDAEAIRRFLAADLPQRLKSRALRRLWRTNPVLANLDGLVDYDDDYTDAAMVPDVMRTAYEVGRGIAPRIRDMALNAGEAGPTTSGDKAAVGAKTDSGAAATDTSGVAADDTSGAAATGDTRSTAEARGAAAPEGPGPEAAPAEDLPPAPRRRIRITFDDQPDIQQETA